MLFSGEDPQPVRDRYQPVEKAPLTFSSLEKRLFLWCDARPLPPREASSGRVSSVSMACSQGESASASSPSSQGPIRSSQASA